MAVPVLIGEFQFKTKSAAKDEIKRRISSYEFGDILSPEDQIFFGDLFKLHSEHDSKIGCGIASIQIERDFNNNKCFFINRVDGSRTDISWTHCIQPASTRNIISMAFRREIKDRVVSFKSNQLEKQIMCPILDIPLDFNNSHAAYIDRSFEQLLNEFLKVNGIDIESIEIIDPMPDDKDHRAMLKNSEIRLSWKNYHLANAQLTLISAEANLRRKL